MLEFPPGCATVATYQTRGAMGNGKVARTILANCTHYLVVHSTGTIKQAVFFTPKGLSQTIEKATYLGCRGQLYSAASGENKLYSCWPTARLDTVDGRLGGNDGHR